MQPIFFYHSVVSVVWTECVEGSSSIIRVVVVCRRMVCQQTK